MVFSRSQLARLVTLLVSGAAFTTALPAQTRQATRDLPLEPTRTIHIDTEEGSWISLDVSPDGSTLVFDLLGDLYSMPFGGGTATQLTRGLAFDAQPRFSPDGKSITYTSDKDGGENVWIMDLATKSARAVTKGKDNRYQSPEWTPDGNYVVASRTGIRGPVVQLWMFHKDGGNGIQLIKEPANRMTTGAAFGADGRYLWFAQRTGNWQYNAVFPQYQLAVYDRETGQVSVRSSRNGSGIRPTLSPDGKWLVYGTRFENQTGLRIRNLASGDERWLAFPVQRDDQEARSSRDALPGMSFTPDSREVVASYGGRIWRIPVDGAAPVQIPFRVTTDIDLGPKLAFNYPVSDEAEFTVKQIRDAVPSPDGTKLAFAALDRLYLVDLPGGTPRRLTTLNQTEAEPTWSPDGQWLAFVTWSDSAGGRVLKVRVGGAARGAASQGPVVVSTDAAIYRSPVFSPDGGRIVAVRGPAEAYREGVGPQAPGSATDLVWFPAAGGTARLIAPTGNRGSPHFTQDTGRIFLSGNDGLVSIRFDGTDEKKHVKVMAPPLLSQERPAPADLILMAPRGDQALVQTGFDFYVVTVPQIGAEPATVTLANPANAAVPVRRLSEVGGEFPAWSADGRTVHWSLGNGHFVYDLDRARAFDDSVKRIPRDSTARSDSTKAPTYQPTETRIVVKATRDTPKGTVVLRGGRVVTMQGDRIIERGDVVVTNNRIVAVGETGQVTVPAGARVIDVAGKTITPGFVDTHAHMWPRWEIHWPQPWMYLANLAYGVTTTRDPQTGQSDVVTYGDMVDAGLAIGPRIYSTSTGVGYWLEPLKDLDHTRRVLKRYSDYYDTKTIKMYVKGGRQVRQWVIMAARELGLMPTTEGSLDLKYDLTMVLDGYPGQEHALPIYPLYQDVIQLMAQSGIAYTPTLIVAYGGPWAENYYYTHDAPYNDPKLRRFTPYEELAAKTRRRAQSLGGWFMDEEQSFPALAGVANQIVKAGGLVGVGSHGQLQGLGYHWELWSLASGGMSNFEVLRAATIQGALALGLSRDLGSIETGKLADLVILDRNPLDDIRNSNSVRYVMRNGRLYEGDTLAEVWPTAKPGPKVEGLAERPVTNAGVH